jgi:hypothetical protein
MRWQQGLWASVLLALVPQMSAAEASKNEPPGTWSAFDRAATRIAESTSFLAAEITEGRCEPVHDLDADRTLGIGSSFKLYILGELGHQIRKGRFESNLPEDSRLGPWEQPVAIEARYKSIPGGPLLFVPDGTVVTVRYLAEQMIQRSDNTATDHLLFLLGRERVEQRMGRMGHHDPALNRPLFATREFAVLKLLGTDAEIETYLAASTRKRRQILRHETRGFEDLRDQAEGQTAPLHIDTLEWFADRFDMCRALLALYELGQDSRARPVSEVLTLADQIGIDRERFPYVGFKGGSEVGVLAGNWLLERDDGRRFTMTIAFNDTEHALDLAAIVEVLQAAVDLIYETP